VPKSLDPLARGRKMPVPDERPSEKIAKLFPQTIPLKSAAKPADTAVTPAPGSAAKAAAVAKNAVPAAAPVAQAAPMAKPVPLPEARPRIDPAPEKSRHRYRRYRHR
jgi:membrane-bound lytic murein transglycosylase A